MKVLCDENIPPGLIQALQGTPSLDVTKIQNLIHQHPIPDSAKDQVMGYGYDVLLTGLHRFLKRNTNYGVLHYNILASDRTVASEVDRIARNNNPYSHLNEPVP